ncbi:hypothetical protein E4T39_00697 [Aureobasidium subglaciale]|nr:hypothetical protein E4T39_00697 [Aureobasidium subglaciale]
MRFILIAILAGIDLAAAQSTSTCAAQSVLNLCVSQQQASTSRCGPTDYDCLCQGYTTLVVCYNNCPNDAGAFTASQNKIQYCQAASQYVPCVPDNTGIGSLTGCRYGSSAIQSQSATASISGALSSALSSASSSAAAASSTRASAASSISRSVSASASSASAAATETGAAANVAAPVAAGVFGIAIGAAALL